MKHEQEFLTVSQFNHLVRDVLTMGFPQPLWICGEIQGFDRNRNKKHVFFELCEKDADSKDIVARIGVVIFAGRREYINQLLTKAANAFQLKDDIEVKFQCRVDFYPPHGAVRLVVESIDPVYTLGRIAQEKQKLIARLTKDGILQKNKEFPLAEVPLNVGLITSPDSAAYNDFLSELKLSGYAFEVLFHESLMQGKGAAPDVCRALKKLSRNTDLDVIVITRGGGSIADLSCFDSERIARAVAACPIPVLSGIGHEINITVTDLAAHTHQKTPTAIARFLILRVETFLTELNQKTQTLLDLAQQRVDEQQEHLYDAVRHLQRLTDFYLRNQSQQLVYRGEALRKQPLRLLARMSQDVRHRQQALVKGIQFRMLRIRTHINQVERLIEMADPVRILQKGFSITRLEKGKLVRGIKDVKPGDGILTKTSDGVFRSRVQALDQKGGNGGKNEVRPGRKKTG